MITPRWDEWAFWLKDPESIRNLVFIFASVAAIAAGAIGIVLATVRSIASVKQANAASEAQITRLLVDAIGFLSDKEKLQLRLGAIYSLERIAQRSKVDRNRILEILYAFLRESTAQRPAPAGALPGTPADIQACLDVIARNPPLRPQRSRLTLANIDLRGVDLQGAKLRRVYLIGADLRNANLTDADLREANLTSANLENAKMQSCQLSNAQMSAANLQSCVLVGADFTLANLTGATLSHATIESAGFTRANLQSAILTNAHAAYATFKGADLRAAKFTNADIRGADFRDFRESAPQPGRTQPEVYRTNLTDTDFTGANRELAKFEGDAPGALIAMFTRIFTLITTWAQRRFSSKK